MSQQELSWRKPPAVTSLSVFTWTWVSRLWGLSQFWSYSGCGVHMEHREIWFTSTTSIPVTDYCILFAHAPVMFTHTTQTGNFEIVKNIFGIYLPGISDTGEVRCLRRAQRTLKDNTHPSNSLFILLHLARDTEVSTAVPTDSRAASFLRLWDFSIHPLHSTIMNSFLFCFLCVALRGYSLHFVTQLCVVEMQMGHPEVLQD